MSRNAVAHDAAEESFAGLLEHLTRRSHAEGTVQDAETTFTSRAGTVADPSTSAMANSTGNGRSGTRVLAPVTEAKAASEGMPLSYEQALRMHARRRSISMNDLDLASIDALPPAAKTEETRKPMADLRTGGSVAKGRLAKSHEPSRAQSTVKPLEILAPSKTPGKVASASSARLGRLPSAAHHKPDAQSSSTDRSKKAAPRRRPTGDSRSLASQTASSPTPGKGRSETLPPGSKPKSSLKHARLDAEAVPHSTGFSKPVSLPNTTADRSLAGKPREIQSLAKVERRESQLEPIHRGNQLAHLAQLNQLAQLDQRRSTVSVRLTDVEFTRLKERAEESGISVSAYMRSCVLDADQLRAQVKYALAEMRAVTVQSESSLLPAIRPPASGGTASGGDWLRVIVRSVTFLLGPLFPFRRSA